MQGGGGGATLTGPAVRGETATLERHLEALQERAPELVRPYRLAVELVLDGAMASDRIDGGSADDIRALLGDR